MRDPGLSAAIGGLVALLAVASAGCKRDDRAKDAAVDACIAAVRTGSENPDPTVMGKTIASGCAPLFAEKSCREGYVKAWDDSTSPDERAHVMLDACAAAYCPKLATPRPTLCTAPDADVARRGAQWADFQRAVLTRDLGPERAERVLGAMKEAGERRLKREK